MKRHKDWDRLQGLLPSVRTYQKLATEHGINDIFQDNGGKILQMLLALNLQGSPGREGNDAVDEEGNEYELKSANLSLTTDFSTHHHLNFEIIGKYRKVVWFFAAFQDIEMRRIYRVEPANLEIKFSTWERKLKDKEEGHLNNPKIGLKYIIANGVEVYSDEKHFDLQSAKKIRDARKSEAERIKAEARERAGLPPLAKKSRQKKSQGTS